MKLNAKGILVPTAILFIICVVVSSALVGTNALTMDKINEQALKKADESRMLVLPAAESFEIQNDGEYYIGKTGGETVGYVFETDSKGYGGTVEVMTGIDTEGNITGVVILSHNETPGLGANAEKAEYTDQYKQPAPESGLELVKFQTPSEGQIEALTGATITSKSVTDAVNDAVEKYQSVKGGN